jgi:chromosome segregation ATPase
MKKAMKLSVVLGSMCVAGSLVGSVAFADTNASQTSQPGVKAQLQSDRATLMPLQTQNKQLDQQIKADYAAWRKQNPNPLTQLSNDQLLKNLKTDIQSQETTVKNDVAQAKSLFQQLKAAKQNKDKATPATVKANLALLVQQIKAARLAIKADRQNIAAALPTSVKTAFHNNQAALKAALKNDLAKLKVDRQPLKAELAQLKADVKAKNAEGLQTDMTTVASELNTVVTDKKNLLNDFSMVLHTNN